MLVEAEIIKQPRRRPLNSHHRLSPAESAGFQGIIPPPQRQSLTDFFNDIRHNRT
jgi:hypothetical protein